MPLPPRDEPRRPSPPAAAARLAEYLGRVVAAASLAPSGDTFASGLPCRRRPQRKPCTGWLEITRQDVPPTVHYRCPRCGDGGMIEGWRGGPSDLSALAEPQGEGESERLFLGEEEQRTGLKLDLPDAGLLAMFLRARPRGMGFESEASLADLEMLSAWLDKEVALARSPLRRRSLQALQDAIVAQAAIGVLAGFLDDLLDGAPEPRRPPRRRRRRGAARDVRLKATLLHVRPPVWRRLVLPGELTLSELHHVLQIAFGWYDCHLHQFRTNGYERVFADPEFVDAPGVEDEADVRVADLLSRKGERLVYEYDFGDFWEHALVVEEVLEGREPVPRCLGGRRSAPPEDCGGPPGYAELLQALADPRHPQHAELCEWAPLDFDPEDFDAEGVDAALAGGLA